MFWWVKRLEVDSYGHCELHIMIAPCVIYTGENIPKQILQIQEINPLVRTHQISLMISTHTSRLLVFRPSTIKLLYNRLSNYSNLQPFLFTRRKNKPQTRMHLHNAVTKMLQRRTLGMNEYASQSHEILIKQRKK